MPRPSVLALARRNRARIAFVAALGAAAAGVLFVGCDAGGGAGGLSTGNGSGPSGTGGESGTGGSDGDGGDGSNVSTASITVAVGSGGGDASTTASGQNPCGTECGDTELCDGASKGLDDDCDGEVDEGCPCAPGEANDCFKGDPSYRAAEGCFPGSMRCTEFGTWGSCDGGAHAWGESPCQEGSLEGCHPITAVPFQVVNLKEGTGTFSNGAEAESWTVTCPEGVSPCPGVTGTNPADDFQPLQSGEYTVTYTKTVGGQDETCSYPLFVGARGLRVELTWTFGNTTDLDLHMMKPGTAGVFASRGSEIDCAWDNCTVSSYALGLGPEWFPESAPDGDPVAWYLDPVDQLNTCYYAPRGVGDDWRDLQQGCHNPRLDLDNVTCDPSLTDVNDFDFCAPENSNVDFPPKDQWTRIGVVSYSGGQQRPTVKIFCDGALKAVLGPEGFNTPVTMPASGSSPPGIGDSQTVWFVADVAFVEDECSKECVVSPIYQGDPSAGAPWIVPAPGSGPAFPPIPTPGE